LFVNTNQKEKKMEKLDLAMQTFGNSSSQDDRRLVVCAHLAGRLLDDAALKKLFAQVFAEVGEPSGNLKPYLEILEKAVCQTAQGRAALWYEELRESAAPRLLDAVKACCGASNAAELINALMADHELPLIESTLVEAVPDMVPVPNLGKRLAEIGIDYAQGKDWPQSYERAVLFMRTAADAGYHRVYLPLARLLRQGYGAQAGKALYYYKLAARSPVVNYAIARLTNNTPAYAGCWLEAKNKLLHSAGKEQVQYGLLCCKMLRKGRGVAKNLADAERICLPLLPDPWALLELARAVPLQDSKVYLVRAVDAAQDCHTRAKARFFLGCWHALQADYDANVGRALELFVLSADDYPRSRVALQKMIAEADLQTRYGAALSECSVDFLITCFQ
jgi:TPR repeat protein